MNGPENSTTGSWILFHGETAEALVSYCSIAPHAIQANPYPDHYIPLLAAIGAADQGARGTILHQSWDLGDLGIGAFEFLS